MKNTDVATTSRVASLFARKLIVHLGTADTDRNGLNTSAGAEAQGANRYQRGKYYFSEAKRISTKDGCSLNWDKYEVAGVAHEYAKMAAAGAKNTLLSKTKILSHRLNSLFLLTYLSDRYLKCFYRHRTYKDCIL